MLGRLLTAGLALGALTFGATSQAADEAEFHLVIQNHRFEPAELVVPAGKSIKLIVENKDDTPEEFESDSLKREKIVAGGTSITVLVDPLEPGTYDFYGEFNPE